MSLVIPPQKLTFGRRRLAILLACRTLIFFTLAASASGAVAIANAIAAEDTFFFASPEACFASFMFKRRECDIAFANAASELRRSGGDPASKTECVRRYQLCERQMARDEKGKGEEVKNKEAGLYVPLMLGVALANSGHGWSATPMLAVELPAGRLQPQPVSHLIVAAPPKLPATALIPDWLASVTHAFVDQLSANPAPHPVKDEERARAERRESIRKAPTIY